MANSKKLSLQVPPILNIFLRKFHRFVLGLVESIDANGINVAQPIWLSDCPTQAQFCKKTNIFPVFCMKMSVRNTV
jgi:hypothetical protein